MLRVTFAFKMAPSNLKIKESIIEFYKLHSKKAMVIPIINGNALTCLKEQFIGFWRSFTKRALLKENLVQESTYNFR